MFRESVLMFPFKADASEGIKHAVWKTEQAVKSTDSHGLYLKTQFRTLVASVSDCVR
jgi:hypothetical protein